jgi:hypothetical protein
MSVTSKTELIKTIVKLYFNNLFQTWRRNASVQKNTRYLTVFQKIKVIPNILLTIKKKYRYVPQLLCAPLQATGIDD